MDWFPIFLRLQQRACLIVGGGEVAARKTTLLLKANANVTIVAPHLCDELQRAVQAQQCVWLKQAWSENLAANLLSDQILVIAATNDEALNQQVAEQCKQRQVPVNVVDMPDACDWVTPSIIDRSPIMVAITTGGAAPVLGRRIRQQIEQMLPSNYGQLADAAREFRTRVKNALPDGQARLRFWEKAFGGKAETQILNGQTALAEETWASQLADTQQSDMSVGEVYLVGAGPGDPDLLTLKALRLMQQADVVLYDKLVSEGVMDLVRRDAERIYVGKSRDFHTLPQADINAKLVELAKEGKRVLRLKGGDPFIFGRGGEEIAELAEHDVPFQVVPGITAASGCSSYAGIPLTHRDHAQRCVFVTGHLKDGSIDLDWPSLANTDQTTVFYMGLKGLPVIMENLQAHGLAADFPVAVVEQGTTSAQRVIVGTLESIAELVDTAALGTPSLIIVGSVVGLRDTLAWYQTSEATIN